MDNLTHSLTGWAIGQTGLKAKSRKGLAALILGANLPDVDIFFGWVDWPPLAVHRGFTHGLLGGVLLLPPFLAGLLWLLDRWQLARGATFASGLPMRFGWLLALAYIGAASHPLLDLQNTYAVQLLSPFDDGWFHNDALFIIDVWLWVALAIGIELSRRRERAGQAWGRPASAALAGIALYIAANAGLSLIAKRALIASGAARSPDVLIAGIDPLLFWNRTLIWREQGRIGRARFKPFTGLRMIEPPIPDGMDDPAARRAMRASREVVMFMRWSILPTAKVTRERCRALVRFGDARFGGPTVRSGFERRVAVPIAGPGCPPLAKAE